MTRSAWFVTSPGWSPKGNQRWTALNSAVSDIWRFQALIQKTWKTSVLISWLALIFFESALVCWALKHWVFRADLLWIGSDINTCRCPGWRLRDIQRWSALIQNTFRSVSALFITWKSLNSADSALNSAENANFQSWKSALKQRWFSLKQSWFRAEQRWFSLKQLWNWKFSEQKNQRWIRAVSALIFSETELIFSETALKHQTLRAKNQRWIRAVSALIFSERELNSTDFLWNSAEKPKFRSKKISSETALISAEIYKISETALFSADLLWDFNPGGNIKLW